MLKKKSGFTLIEVILVLAIVGLMIPLIFQGQSTLRARFQFTDSVDQLKNRLVGVKNDTLTTVNTGTGDDTSNVFFGYAVEFSSSPNTSWSVYPLTIANGGTLITKRAAGTKTLAYLWGTTYTGSTQGVIFARNQETGDFVTYSYTGSLGGTFDLSTLSTDTVVTIPLTSPRGYTGSITVITARNVIDRTINP